MIDRFSRLRNSKFMIDNTFNFRSCECWGVRRSSGSLHSPRNGTPLVIVKTESRPLVLQPLHQMQPRCTQEHSKTESTSVQKSPTETFSTSVGSGTHELPANSSRCRLVTVVEWLLVRSWYTMTLRTYLNFYFSPLTGSDSMIASRMPLNFCISIEETQL